MYHAPSVSNWRKAGIIPVPEQRSPTLGVQTNDIGYYAGDGRIHKMDAGSACSADIPLGTVAQGA
jgi:hypothetical protein